VLVEEEEEEDAIRKDDKRIIIMDYRSDYRDDNHSRYAVPSTISRRLPNVSNIYEVPLETSTSSGVSR